MDVIEHFEATVLEAESIVDKMKRVSIIQDAAEELRYGELHPDTAKELISIGISPQEFIKRFQETEIID